MAHRAHWVRTDERKNAIYYVQHLNLEGQSISSITSFVLCRLLRSSWPSFARFYLWTWAISSLFISNYRLLASSTYTLTQPDNIYMLSHRRFHSPTLAAFPSISSSSHALCTRHCRSPSLQSHHRIYVLFNFIRIIVFSLELCVFVCSLTLKMSSCRWRRLAMSS